MSDSSSPFFRRLNKRDSGFAGRKAEYLAALRMKGVQQPGSGVFDSAKGDFKLSHFLVENKTAQGDSFTLRGDFLLKIYQEALEQNRYPLLAFQFVRGSGQSSKRDRWVALPEHVFALLAGVDYNP